MNRALFLAVLGACSEGNVPQPMTDCSTSTCPSGYRCVPETHACALVDGGTPAPPVIAEGPVDQIVVAPGAATFAVAAGGLPTLSYQWQKGLASGTTTSFSDIEGATAATYTTPATTLDDGGTRFRVIVSNAGGSTASDSAVLGVGLLINIRAFGTDGNGVSGFSPGGPYGVPVPPLLTATVPPGAYRLVDAWGRSDAPYDAWNYQTGFPGTWGWAYMVYAMRSGGAFDLLANVRGPNVKGDCVYCYFDTEAQARDAAAAFPSQTLLLADPTTLVFAVPDYALGDNAGGVSLIVARVGDPGAADAGVP